jgi:hypothetical protein
LINFLKALKQIKCIGSTVKCKSLIFDQLYTFIIQIDALLGRSTFLSCKNFFLAINSLSQMSLRSLFDWIQREAIDSHSESITKYIAENDQRFLGSIIIGLYDGKPNWAL